MKELPLICNDFEVRQILEDRKTQLRRLVLPPPSVDTDCPYHEELGNAVIGRNCPMGERGDKTWVREKMGVANLDGRGGKIIRRIWYAADNKILPMPASVTIREWKKGAGTDKWRGWVTRVAANMPRWASRLTLETQNTCIQRLQAITEPDAISEGMLAFPNTPAYQCAFLSAVAIGEKPPLGETPRERFERYWNTLYAKPKPVYYKKKIIAYQSFPWEDIQTILVHRNLPWRVMGNPFVWKCEFRRLHD
jgi:hypothetical protein